jgi:hypothetical protein
MGGKKAGESLNVLDLLLIIPIPLPKDHGLFEASSWSERFRRTRGYDSVSPYFFEAREDLPRVGCGRNQQQPIFEGAESQHHRATSQFACSVMGNSCTGARRRKTPFLPVGSNCFKPFEFLVPGLL